MTERQTERAINWLRELLSTNKIDWIVAANAMDALAYFVKLGGLARQEFIYLLKIQQTHRSKSVTKKASKHLELLEQ